MTNTANCFTSLADVLESITSVKMDSSFENSAVSFVQKVDTEDAWKLVQTLLASPNASTRALGLRVVRRGFKDKELLRRVIHLCFSVDRLSELQYWYAAILARYPMMGFVSLLKNEMIKSEDPDFVARHIRALQMHKAAGSKSKKEGLKKLFELSLAIKPQGVAGDSD